MGIIPTTNLLSYIGDVSHLLSSAFSPLPISLWKGTVYLKTKKTGQPTVGLSFYLLKFPKEKSHPKDDTGAGKEYLIF